VLGGAALGAIAMFLSDPVRGHRRRALARDKMYSVATRTRNAIDVASRDLGNRAHGLRAQASHIMSKDNTAVDDRVLMERVRQRIGRVVSHPHAIEVAARDGCVTLSGPVLLHEEQRLLSAVRHVQGVTSVQDRLEIHERPTGVSSLQGGGKSRASPARSNWTPAARAMALIGGGTLGIFGLMRRTPARWLYATTGAALMARGVSNMPFMRMAGLSGDKRAVDFHKTIHIEAPPEKVFDLWSKCENFPHFMSNVQEVRDLGNGRSHWIVNGPAGVQFEWDSMITESRRPELLTWSSAPESTIQNSGSIRFDPDGNGTRVNIHMSYNPPAGILGHAIATMFASDPKRQMDNDLMRMKAYIETGRAPHDATHPEQQPREQSSSGTLH